MSERAESQDKLHDSDYRLRSGTNEFTFWGGGSFHATTSFGGLHKDEVRGRKFVIAALRYGRTLSANSSVALQYTLDVIPLALATNNVTRETVVASPGGPVVNIQRGSVYGGGAAGTGARGSKPVRADHAIPSYHSECEREVSGTIQCWFGQMDDVRRGQGS